MAPTEKYVYSFCSSRELVFSCFSKQIGFHFQIDLLKRLIEVKFDGEGGILAQEHVLQFTYNCLVNKILDPDVLCRLLAFTFEGRVKEWFVTLPISSVHSFEHFVDLFVLSFGHYDFVRLCDEWKLLTRRKGESLEDFAIRIFNLYCRFPLTDRPMIHEWFQHNSSITYDSYQLEDDKYELYIDDQ